MTIEEDQQRFNYASDTTAPERPRPICHCRALHLTEAHARIDSYGFLHTINLCPNYKWIADDKATPKNEESKAGEREQEISAELLEYMRTKLEAKRVSRTLLDVEIRMLETAVEYSTRNR